MGSGVGVPGGNSIPACRNLRQLVCAIGAGDEVVRIPHDAGIGFYIIMLAALHKEMVALLPFQTFQRSGDIGERSFGRKRFVEQDLALGAVYQIPDRIMQNPLVRVATVKLPVFSSRLDLRTTVTLGTISQFLN